MVCVHIVLSNESLQGMHCAADQGCLARLRDPSTHAMLAWRCRARIGILKQELFKQVRPAHDLPVRFTGHNQSQATS